MQSRWYSNDKISANKMLLKNFHKATIILNTHVSQYTLFGFKPIIYLTQIYLYSFTYPREWKCYNVSIKKGCAICIFLASFIDELYAEEEDIRGLPAGRGVRLCPVLLLR